MLILQLLRKYIYYLLEFYPISFSLQCTHFHHAFNDLIQSTTKTYEKGQYVTLAFDNKKLWEDCYYRDPDGGEILKAWRIHVNFIGEVIEPQAIAAEKSRIDDLERRVQEKIKEIAQRREASIEGEKIN